MQIPLKASNRPPLELCEIKLYSTGSRGKVFTNHFYKALNHNFGIEIVVKNNTATVQTISVGGCVYDSSGATITKWGRTSDIGAFSSFRCDFYVREDTFVHMKEGKYKVQFWINNKKVQKEFFTVTYK